jgi:hypothetical protein
MLAMILAMAVILEAPNPSELVSRLGSPRYASRVEAERDLAGLGRSALPALREARGSRDAEIRTRSAALINQIERASLLESSPVRLDVRDTPLSDLVDAIGLQSGSTIALDPEDRALLAGRRLTVRSNGPLTFWGAVDAVCSAGRVHESLVETVRAAGAEGGLTLLDGPMNEGVPVSDSGPFRVRVTSVHARSEIVLDRPRPEEKPAKSARESTADAARPAERATREFFLFLNLAVEPRLTVAASGPIRLAEAVDDLGRSLLGSVGPAGFRHVAGYSGISVGRTFSIRVDLDTPEAPARRIRLLKGSIPVVVSARKPEPLVVPLAGPRGRVHRGEEVTLAVLDQRAASDGGPATIQLGIRSLIAAEPTPAGRGEPRGFRPETYQDRLEILDAQGRPMSWFASRVFYDDEETRITLTIDPRDSFRVPTSARFHAILKANAEVPFEFHDVPLP